MIRGAILDIDGTVVRGHRVLPGALDTLAHLRRGAVRYAFFTNDNQRPVRAWVKRLADMGIEASADQVITSALVAAEAVVELYAGLPVLAVGDAGLVEALQGQGIDLVGWEEVERAKVVVMGKDPSFNQERLAAVSRALWNGAAFVATNVDPKVPTGSGFAPGTGPMVQAVAYATGVDPLVVGKPSPWAGRMAARILGVAPGDTVVVGDQIATDIAMGKAAGMKTVLVLTGSSTAADAAGEPPDAVLDSIAELPRLLEEWAAPD